MTSYIMVQGTSSHVGKSILATALCRIFFQDGKKVVPFKAQNMALNSYVTKTGEEMGRAQVAQAEAAGLEPMVEMNPVLLKPTGNACSQVVLMGRPVGNMSAKKYHAEYALKAFGAVKDALAGLSADYDVVVIEGAGSPAEVNLKANDIVNMRVAKHVNAPVLLVADIDRGGALASVVGTLELLEKDERDLVKGIVINKFRGDIGLLKPALEFLEKKTGKPVLGVIPHLRDLGIDDEDSVSLAEKDRAPKTNEIQIAVVKTPKISNFTDFDCLTREPDVSLYYADSPDALGNPDLVLLPGSKNTTEDLLYLRKTGMEQKIKDAAARGTALIGVCGGYQMLGQSIHDPSRAESDLGSVEGLGLLPIKTTFIADKLTYQVKANYHSERFLHTGLSFTGLSGYEIHMGRTEFTSGGAQRPFTVIERSGKAAAAEDGAISEDGLIMGTYIHGIFDNDAFRRSILNALRAKKHLPPLEHTMNFYAQKQRSYNRLADAVRKNLDMNLLTEILEKQ